MPSHPHLTRRGNVFWLRRKVPADLRDHYAPKTHIAFSLRTTDPKEALRVVRRETVKLDEAFEAIRTYRAAPVQSELTDAEIRRLVALRKHELLEGDEIARQEGLGAREMFNSVREQVLAAGGTSFYPADGPQPLSGLNDREFHQISKTLEFILPGLREDLARGDTSLIQDDVEALLEANGIKLDPQSPSRRKLDYAILKADVEAYTAMAERQKGEPVDTPPEPPRPHMVPTVSAPQAGDITIQELWRRYLQERKPPEKTAADFGTNIRRFVEVNGNLPVQSVTKAHARAFKDAMLRMPVRLGGKNRALTVPQVLERFEEDTETPRLNPRTVNEKALAAVRAVFGYAVDNGFRDDNPIAGVKATGATSSGPSRIPYSPQDLKVIFGSEVFTKGARPIGGGGEAAKWLPLLALFTGARLEELGSLDTQDVREEQGVFHLFIHADSAGRSVKTGSSRRKVPVHPELVRLGFLDYVQERRKTHDKPLFPDLQSARAQRTAAFSSWWGRYTTKLGLTDPRKVFHSFRHGVKRELRQAHVDKSLRDALMGHATRDVAEQYGLDEEGAGFDLPTLQAAISKLRYPGLELPA